MALAGCRLMWLSLASRTEVYGQAMQKVGMTSKPEMWGRGLISKTFCFGSQKRSSLPAPALLLIIS
jgi:hypothetical protein